MTASNTSSRRSRTGMTTLPLARLSLTTLRLYSRPSPVNLRRLATDLSRHAALRPVEPAGSVMIPAPLPLPRFWHFRLSYTHQGPAALPGCIKEVPFRGAQGVLGQSDA